MPQVTISSWLAQQKVMLTDSQRAPDRSGDTGNATQPDVSSQSPSDGEVHSSRARNLPPQAQIESLSDAHILGFQRLNALLLPIPYQSSFYKETQHDPIIASLTKIVTWQDRDSRHKMSAAACKFMSETAGPDRQLVAAIRCRLIVSDPSNPDGTDSYLYISTIGTLAPFREHGLAGHLLREVMRIGTEKYGASRVVAHVWEANEDGLDWYQRRGFKIVRKEKGYYKRLAPKPDAWVIQKDIQPSDVVG